MTIRIVTRREWGARYADGFGPLKPPAAEVWLHHTGGNEPDSFAGIRQLEQVGQDRFGGGISYTFLVGQSGTVYEGTTPNREGAHTLGHNTVGRGICWIGNFDVLQPTEQIIQSTVELLVLGRDRGWWTHAALSGGHRDVYATDCPGDHAYTLISAVNQLAAGEQKPSPGAAVENFRVQGTGTLPIICPVGKTSAITAAAWVSACSDGPSGGTVRFWFQHDTGGISDVTKQITFADGHSQRPWVPVPDGTTMIRAEYTFPSGGTICVETKDK